MTYPKVNPYYPDNYLGDEDNPEELNTQETLDILCDGDKNSELRRYWTLEMVQQLHEDGEVIL